MALALLIFGLISLNTGLNLVDSPVTFASAAQAAGSTWSSVFNGLHSDAPPAHESLKSDIRLEARNNGYYPRALYAPAGQPLKLHLVTNNTTSCDRDFTIPSLNIDVLLDETGEKVIDLPLHEAGYQLHFTCSMGMYTGDIIYR